MATLQKKEWERVYSKIPLKELPWYGLEIPKPVKKFINRLSKNEAIYVTGCGAGDLVNYVHTAGYQNVLGIDISSTAIKIAKKRFPSLRYIAKSTESFALKKPSKGSTIDLYVLHHIEPQKLLKYISALEAISKNLICCYFYDAKKPSEIRSFVKKKQKLYNYNPKMIEKLFSEMKLTKEESYMIPIRIKSKKIKMRVVAQTYSR